MDTVRCDDSKVRLDVARCVTRHSAIMAKLNDLAESLQGDMLEVTTVPVLYGMSAVVLCIG
jgi:hypothetical protein